MALKPKAVVMNKGPQQEPMEAGSYPARLVQIIDLGIQPQPDYKGESKPPAHEIMFTYEFLDEFCLDEDGEELEDKPRWLSETFPLRSLDSDLAKSTKRYNALDPDNAFGGDFTCLIETPCTVTVVNNAGKGKNAGKVFNNIGAVSAMRPKDARNAKELVNPPKVFVIDEPDVTVFKSLPQWLQDKIKGGLEYGGSALEKALEGTVSDDDEVPKGKVAGKPKKPVEKPVEPEEDDEVVEDEPW